ncbi:MAG: bifunctional UDP-N-acetylmuramoyl-tripeptide:D-alanyl-D-alanine ligase/alanine racemase [Ferruginibacter sp.]
MYTIAQIQQQTGGTFLLQHNGSAAVEHLLTDSRKLLFPSTTLFFAIAGPRRKGHAFIKELYLRGVRNFITDSAFSIKPAELAEANIIVTENVQSALQSLAAYHRSQFTYPVIGVTGSNGKTIVKEWLYQLLQADYNIVRSPKSYNSQIGVPLSVWQMNAQHNLAIFEAGISEKGEMPRLQQVIAPTVGVFTNIGEAHSEGFDNMQEKVTEKALLFEGAGVIIYCKDETVVDEVLRLKQPELFTWGQSEQAVLQVSTIQVQAYNTVIKAVYRQRKISISIPFTNDAAIKNAITCWCVLLQLQIPDEVISQRMLQLKPVEMRLELKEGINHCSVINDSYSADLTSLSIALDFLQQQQQHSKKTVIVSDILQSGKTGQQLYHEMAGILQQKNISRFMGIGSEISRYRDCFDQLHDTVFFKDTAEFVRLFPTLHFHDETILLKGARVFEFEQISHLLEQKTHQTVLEINLNAITHNLNAYQQLLNPGVKLMAMVKAFSYGSGSFEIANLLQFHKVDYLAVAYADEGVELRKAGITLPIMVMNAEESTFDMLLQYDLEPELYSFGILDAFEKYLQQNAVSHYPVHIKLDTGMHRLGFEPSDMKQLAAKLESSPQFKIQTVFSHLAASDSPSHDAFTLQQAEQFLKGCSVLEKKLGYPIIKHIANTSAIHRHKNLQLDMVRLGIGLYGVDGHAPMQQQLKNVSTLKTTISQIKKVKKGESVGYSRKGLVDRNSQIATVRIGYADGYPRNLSNGAGQMLVNGKLVPVIGNVCMDMTMLDITGVDAAEGDDVIVFGAQLPVTQLAQWSDTIAYEILTGISQRVKRVYYEE